MSVRIFFDYINKFYSDFYLHTLRLSNIINLSSNINKYSLQHQRLALTCLVTFNEENISQLFSCEFSLILPCFREVCTHRSRSLSC